MQEFQTLNIEILLYLKIQVAGKDTFVLTDYI